METTKPPSSRTPEAQAWRQRRILDAVIELLKEGGMSAVTTDSVSKRADVSKATIYKYWSNKSEFVVLALETVIQQIDISDMGSFKLELAAFLRERCRQYSQPQLNRVIAAAVGASIEDPLFAEAFHGWVSSLMQTNVQIIERGIQRGEVSRDIDVDAIATMIASPLVYRLVWERQAPSEKLVDTVVETMARALHPDVAIRVGDSGT